ncbi:MAG: hypothetical protein AAFQ12_11420 [Pseudomonadota bacterium]
MSPSMSFTVWMSGLLLLPFGWHFGTVFDLWGTPPATRAEFFIRIAIIVVLFVIASIVIAIMTASRTGDEEFEPDEREQIIVQKAERNGYYALSCGLVYIMWAVFEPMSAMDTANALLAIICFGEVVKIVSGLLYLRTGHA